MKAQLTLIRRETLLILAVVLVAYYALKLSVENRARTESEFANVINNDAY